MIEKLYLGNCLDYLKTLPDNSVDSLVTDPPYGLSKEPNIEEVLSKWLAGENYSHNFKGFMGTTWDSFVPSPEIFREIYRVLKPGAHGVVFASTRAQDLMAISLRLANFEIRDVLSWIFFSGFPKALDVSKAIDKKLGAEREVIGETESAGIAKDAPPDASGSHIWSGKLTSNEGITEQAKAWEGWKTQLKPAHEPIILIRKPLSEKSVADNVLKHGTGAMNIDGCRIGTDEMKFSRAKTLGNGINMEGGKAKEDYIGKDAEGRFPANCITEIEDEFFSPYFNITPKELSKKASKKDRNSDYLGEEIQGEESEENLQGLDTRGRTLTREDGTKTLVDRWKGSPSVNNHPTVKSISLMEFLVKLITPPNGIVLDPFSGSGTSLVAAKKNGFSYIGAEMNEDYMKIIQKRLHHYETENQKEDEMLFSDVDFLE